jgi:hypothetical protein
VGDRGLKLFEDAKIAVLRRRGRSTGTREFVWVQVPSSRLGVWIGFKLHDATVGRDMQGQWRGRSCQFTNYLTT